MLRGMQGARCKKGVPPAFSQGNEHCFNQGGGQRGLLSWQGLARPESEMNYLMSPPLIHNSATHAWLDDLSLQTRPGISNGTQQYRRAVVGLKSSKQSRPTSFARPACRRVLKAKSLARQVTSHAFIRVKLQSRYIFGVPAFSKHYAAQRRKGSKKNAPTASQ